MTTCNACGKEARQDLNWCWSCGSGMPKVNLDLKIEPLSSEANRSRTNIKRHKFRNRLSIIQRISMSILVGLKTLLSTMLLLLLMIGYYFHYNGAQIDEKSLLTLRNWVLVQTGNCGFTKMSCIDVDSWGIPNSIYLKSPDYKYLITAENQLPAFWYECQPLTYEVNLNGAPRSFLKIVRQSFLTINAVFTRGFTFKGLTTAETSGEIESDILINFVGDLKRNAAAVGGMDVVRRVMFPKPESLVAEKGSIKVLHEVLDYSKEDQRSLMMHELGHVLGLGHPQSNHQLMSPGSYELGSNLQSGDIQGLRNLELLAGCKNS